MTPRVNLLPIALQRHRLQRQRRRMWIIVCLVASVIQAGGFFVLDMKAHEARNARTRAAHLAKSLKQEKSERDALFAKSEAIHRELRTAERLREKHLWSRWFGTLGLIVPSQVVLTEIKTEPTRFTGVAAAHGVNNNESDAGVRIIRISGAAAEHRDLLSLLEQMNATKMFRSVHLEQARRDNVTGKEAIGFTLMCEW